MSDKKQEPYIARTVTTTEYSWNPDYPADDVCICSHPYYRHFDTYENMSPVGCKYCLCSEFKSKIEDILKENAMITPLQQSVLDYLIALDKLNNFFNDLEKYNYFSEESQLQIDQLSTNADVAEANLRCVIIDETFIQKHEAREVREKLLEDNKK